MYKFMSPELVNGILDKFNERDEKTPRMRTVYDQPFQQHPCNLLLYSFRVGFSEQVQEAAAEIVRVAVRIPKLVGNRIEEQVPKK